MARIINSPGVQLTEKDLSLRNAQVNGTSVLVTGFAGQGPVSEPLMITSTSELERTFGLPSTPAERYFYYSCREVLNSPSILTTIRLPYGEGAGTSHTTSGYSGLFYPVSYSTPSYEITSSSTTVSPGNSAVSFMFSTSGTEATSIPYAITAGSVAIKSGHSDSGTSVTVNVLSSDSYTVLDVVFALTQSVSYDSVALSGTLIPEWQIDAPIHKTFNQADYQKLVDGNFTWNDPSLSASTTTPYVSSTDGLQVGAGFFVINSAQTTVNEFAEGYYVGFADNSAFDGTVSPDFASVGRLNTLVSLSSFAEVTTNRLDFSLSATSEQSSKGLDSVSEQLEKVGFVGFESDAYSDHLSFGVFRIRRSTADSSLLTLANSEKFLGSFDVNRRTTSPTGGTLVNAYIEDSINSNSSAIKMYVNPEISSKFKWTGNTTVPLAKIRNKNSNSALTPVGVYTPDTRAQEANKQIGLIPLKLDRALRTVESIETVVIDILVDAGLSTIHSAVTELNVQNFDDERALSASTDVIDSWQTVANTFINFAQNTRKDCFAIIDPVRSIFVMGRDGKVADSLSKTFTTDIYTPLRECTSSLGDTNYGAMYGNWIKINDIFSGRNFWAPFSGYAAAIMGRSDSVGQFWTPPAGLNRGGFRALDVAFNPNQKQRDRLYEISVNPVVFFLGDGYVVMGQKTLQARPTAFDRINVRRLFLSLERATQKTLKYFVFEPNTVFTRSRLVNTILPIFVNAKQTDGLYDFLIVCDERNNTPDTIDQNELIVDIYLKPVKAAEFILVNFIATRTGQNFSELL